MTFLKRLGAPVIAVVVLGMVAAATVVWQASGWWSDRSLDDRRQAAVDTAEAQVLDLTTMDTATVEGKLEALSGRLTGDFKRQFEGFAENFVNAVTDQKISATGEIRASAISAYDDDAATVIVASTAEVGQGKAAPVERSWRFTVDLERTDDEWLIAGMEFVP